MNWNAPLNSYVEALDPIRWGLEMGPLEELGLNEVTRLGPLRWN